MLLGQAQQMTQAVRNKIIGVEQHRQRLAPMAPQPGQRVKQAARVR